jgi:hypothetical protein
VVNVLKNNVLLELVVEEFVASTVVAIDGKDKLGVAIVVVVSSVDQPDTVA